MAVIPTRSYLLLCTESILVNWFAVSWYQFFGSNLSLVAAVLVTLWSLCDLIRSFSLREKPLKFIKNTVQLYRWAHDTDKVMVLLYM